uniref:Small ribosomal subunit protein eS8 n=1 Tax=Magallana gigas TaxID=29159 RepID=A0A8W8NDG9_MAGGI
IMGISRDKWHKRRKTGGRMTQIRKKRKFELGRPAANTKAEKEEAVLKKLESASKKTKRKYAEREKLAKVEHALDDQFSAGRVLAKVASRPGQCGRCDGYILEGKELEFYQRKLKTKKGK